MIRVLLVAGLSLLLVTLSPLAPLRLVDGVAFDRLTALAQPQPPQVVIIDVDQAAAADGNLLARLLAATEKAGFGRLCLRRLGIPSGTERTSAPFPLVVGTPVEAVPGRNGWRFVGEGLPRGLAATTLRPALDYGVLRSQFRAVPDGAGGLLPMFESACANRPAAHGSYLVPMPAAQNIPRIPLDQLEDGLLDRATTAGLTAVVGPLPPARDGVFATPLDPAMTTSATEFSARAVQALQSGSEVRRVDGWQRAALIALAVALGLVLAALPRHKRLALPLAAGGTVALLVACWGALEYGRILIPVSAMTIGTMMAGFAELILRERAQDRYLSATLEEAINLSFDRALFHDMATLPEHLVAASQALRLSSCAVVGRDSSGAWQILAQGESAPPSLDPGSRAQKALFERTLKLMRAQLSSEGAVWLVPVAGGEAPMVWLYTLPKSRDAEARGLVVREIARGLRQARGWQHSLLGGDNRGGSPPPVDVRVASAANLITIQSEQIRRGLDALDTAVLVFHPAGFALEANGRMSALCAQFGIVPERIGMTAAILALTEIDRAQAEAIVRRMLLRGGEMRVPMRTVAGRSHILRIGSTRAEDEAAARRVIVLEAVDTSQLDQLAQLRLAVGVFIDRQLRNDLEAITLGATLALDPRVGAERIARLAERIRDVAARATGRLEDVAELLEDQKLGSPGPCYPIEVRKCLAPMVEEMQAFASQSGVEIAAQLPGISGFTLAEPATLAAMVEAVLRLVVADTARGGTVRCTVEEAERKTRIMIAGGFGMPFDRLVEALDARPGEVPPEFQVASAGFAQVLAWQGSVAYWSAAGDGYKFTIQLRRIG